MAVAEEGFLARQREEHRCRARKTCCKLWDTVLSHGEGSETQEEAGGDGSKGSGGS